MSDSNDNGSTGFDGGVENTDSSIETTDAPETGSSELYVDEAQMELYPQGVDKAEYEEIMSTTYVMDDKGNWIEQKLDLGTVQNIDGKQVESTPLVFDDSFKAYRSHYNETGQYGIAWDRYKSSDAQENTGFDTSKPISDVVLPEGFIIARYGGDNGINATDKGTPYDRLSLPYDEKSMEYHEYRVCSPVVCKKGTAAGNFGESGGGTQYQFERSFSDMLADGTIERVEE